MTTTRNLAVVAGGSGAIGSAVCRRLAARNFDVLLTYRENVASARAVCRAIESGGGQAEAIQVNLGDLASVEAFAKQVSNRSARVTALVHCAGTLMRLPWDQTSGAQFVEAFVVNCASAFVLAREIAPKMQNAGEGSIVLVSSILAEVGANDRAAYSTSKAALLGLTRALAVELAPTIRVNAIMPGVHVSPMLAPLMQDASRLAATTDRIPLARLGTADEVADAAVFLACSESAYVTGVALPVDGGVLSRTPLPAGDVIR